MCSKPLTAFRRQEGKITFSPPGEEITLPCGQCILCRLNKASQMAIRMVHEQTLHDHSEFLTLTYDDDHLPEDYALRPEDMTAFFKRLRQQLVRDEKEKIRYVYSGEYGEKGGRPHYHAIVFGLETPEKESIKSNNRGDLLYQSEWMDNIWRNGQVIIGNVTERSCRYVASYTIKDAKTQSYKDDWAAIHPITGKVINQRPRPFARYSNKPGIGKEWWDKWKKDLWPTDQLIIKRNGQYIPAPIPQYYFALLKQHHPKMYEYIKELRTEYMDTDQAHRNHHPDRLQAKEYNTLQRIKLAKRGT